MPKAKNPRHGSMQYWPRKRAKRIYPRLRAFPAGKGVLGFPCYKAGMTHVLAVDARKNSRTKGETISVPVTVLECPPVRVAAARFYRRVDESWRAVTDIFFKTDKELSRTTNLSKTPSQNLDKLPAAYDDVRLLVYTQPRLTGIGKKRPELFELHIGGNIGEKIAFIKDHVQKDILISDVFAEGEYVDAHGISKGKGLQGPVKRFGIGFKSHKSEKGVRRPGSLGGWSAQGHVMYRVAQAGQLGFFQRTEYNKQILKIAKPEEVNPKGGFISYGNVKNTALLVKGGIIGPHKRMIVLTKALRLKVAHPAPTVEHISTASQQGVRV